MLYVERCSPFIKSWGVGFLERVYQDALEYEFKERGIPYEREKSIQITYKGKPLGEPLSCRFCLLW